MDDGMGGKTWGSGVLSKRSRSFSNGLSLNCKDVDSVTLD